MRREFLIFEEGNGLFGLELKEVHEIINLRKLMKLPFSAPHLLGLISCKGTMLPVVSPAILLQHQSMHRRLQEFACLVIANHIQVAVAAHQIRGVRSIELPSTGLERDITIEGDQKIILLQVEDFVSVSSVHVLAEEFSR